MIRKKDNEKIPWSKSTNLIILNINALSVDSVFSTLGGKDFSIAFSINENITIIIKNK
jgi:hypothetical protein